MVLLFVNWLQKAGIYFAFADSVDAFRHKVFENRMKNDCFMAMGTLKTCKMGYLLLLCL